MKPNDRSIQLAVTLVKMAVNLLEEAGRSSAAARLREAIKPLEQAASRHARRQASDQ